LPPIRLTKHIEELKKDDFTAATGRRPFSDLRKRVAPERRARNAQATKQMLASMALR
jgi:hypothetical protein